MKKIYILIAGIFLIGIVGALTLVPILLKKTEFPVKSPSPLPPAEPIYLVTFDCAGKGENITLRKSDATAKYFHESEYYHELEMPMREKCPDGKITKIINWQGNDLWENKDCPEKKSFNEDVITECGCVNTGNFFNQTTKECYEIPKELIEP